MTDPNNDIEYTLINDSLSSEVLHKYLEKIRVLNRFSPKFSSEAPVLTIAQDLPQPQSLHNSFIWDFKPKSQDNYDDLDTALMTRNPSSHIRFIKYEFYGLHTYGGYHGFFRPDLTEVINLINPTLLANVDNIERIYVLTEPHPGSNINSCYSHKHDRHQAKTTCYVKYSSDSDRNITLKRGSDEITFVKSPSYFGLRLSNPEKIITAAGVGDKLHVVDTSSKITLVCVRSPAELDEIMSKLRETIKSDGIQGEDYVTHAYLTDNNTNATAEDDLELVIPDNKITIQFKSNTSSEARGDFFAKYNLEEKRELQFMNNAFQYQLRPTATTNPLKIAADLQKHETDMILSAEPELIFYITTAK